MEVKTNSPKETLKVAENLAKTLKIGQVIALFGELGAGKTIFVKGIAKGLNIKKRIASPTFVFQKNYKTKINNKPTTLYHLDLYRGQTHSDFENLGLDEIFSNNSIVILEWAGKIKDRLPKKRIDVIIKKIDDRSRQITIKRT